MANSKSAKIQGDIDKLKAKIAEQQARLKELEQNKREAENSEIVDVVRGMSIPLDELAVLLQSLKGGASGQSVPKSGKRAAAKPEDVAGDTSEGELAPDKEDNE